MGVPTAGERDAIDRLLDLEGRTAIVTGAAMGIGLAIARRLHEAGADIVIADPDPRRTVAAEVFESEREGSAIAIHVDVSDEREVEQMVATATTTFGGVDILVNNAGIYPTCPIAGMEPSLFRKVIEVNLTGLFLATKEAAAAMILRGRGGRIVNITSIDALHPSAVGLAHYDSSKHGAWGFTKNAALEFAPHGIQVNAIAPGGIHTPGTSGTDEQVIREFERMIPMARMGESDEVARAALFLCSDMASYITGSQLVVDGGRLLR